MNGGLTRRERITPRPIGVAYRTDEENVMRIEVYAEYTEALDGIEKLTHINVLYWMHRSTENGRGKLKVHPRGNMDRPLTGVFAIRSPVRPNPIGLTRVELSKREGNVLFVRGLTA